MQEIWVLLLLTWNVQAQALVGVEIANFQNPGGYQRCLARATSERYLHPEYEQLVCWPDIAPIKHQGGENAPSGEKPTQPSPTPK